MRTKPRVDAEYNYASGDKNSKMGRGQPSTSPILPGTTCTAWPIRSAGAIFKDVSAAFEYNNWFLASATGALYSSSGAALNRSAAGTAGTHVGQELDVSAKWSISKPLQVGAGFGHIIPGEFLRKSTHGNPYNYPYVVAFWKF